ncbi:helix-turn-helix transcriptional regulator [Ramlibacter sp.]|uniref:helix-turn-helix transcriptional regulator n=1 Tax=Ramlibacter sp. TaxID=1917967 RepID=UPI0039C948D3
MSHLTRNDYATALALLVELEQAAVDAPHLLQATVERMAGFIPCDTAVLVTGDVDPGAPFAASLLLPADGPARIWLVLRRRRPAFSERDRERLALLQPHLGYLYRQASAQGRPALSATACPQAPPPIRTRQLTPREDDVMRWLSCGKTDADIAALLAISPRTVHKHLEHIYEKLGVETRTAAVMAVRRAAVG